jgi:tRNA uridine 5-carboxymethylaminomethyl modification enzyme
MHLGESKLTGGRMGESASVDLSRSLIGLGLELDRLKTGTPPRLHRRSINWSECDCQPGDVPIPFFSHETPPTFHVEQHPCYLTHTTQKTSEVIMRNLDRSPMFTGKISGIGPRYCPSIEDKIVRFSNKESHQIYLEPEGVSTNEIYVNGASTSLPFDVQMDVIHSIRGLENAELIRPAYAVEYDYCPPTQLHPWLESKHSTGLFLAGQINGTSGYEEAAAQGIVAGINAALMVHGGPRFVMRRDQSYIGVMIDDLVTKGVPEPYRIFTSRAEYRLHLRFDNADLRLSRYGYEFGLISVARYRSICKMALAIDECMQTLRNVKSDGKRLADLLKIPDTDPSDIIHLVPHTDPVVLDHAATLVKYEGYLEREIRDASKYASMESEVIPSTIEYSQVHGLRTEAKSKLEKIRPYTIGQASRIAGVTPADIAVLSVWLRR